MNNKKYNHKAIASVIVAILLIFVIIVSLRVGSVSFSFKEIIDIVFYGSKPNSSSANIIINVRIPRIIIALFVGASLAVSGAMLQAVMQNPLADPGLTGVSSGASLGAAMVMLLFPHLYYLLPIVAFIGGMLACTITYTFAWKNGITPIRIILSGVAVNAIFGSLIGIIYIFYAERVQNALAWMNGSIAGKSWDEVKVLVTYSTIGLITSFFCIRYTNILQLGDKMATNLGTNINFYRVFLSIIAVYLAAIAVSITGPIGFVGLVVPHIGRHIIGSNYIYLIPFSVLFGSFLLLAADTLARTLLSPIELPVGTLMALFGAPFFLYLLRKENKRYA